MALPRELNMRTPLPLDRLHHPRTIRCNDETAAITAAAVDTSPARVEDSSALALRPNSGTATAIGPLHGYVKVRTEQMPWNVSRLGFLGKFAMLELERREMKVSNGSTAHIIGADEVYGKYEVDGPITYALMPKDGFFESAAGHLIDGRLLARIADTCFPDSHTNGLSTGSFSELSTDFNAYHILNLLVYLASNDLVPRYEGSTYLPKWPELLDLLVYRVSRRIVVAIFSTDYLSIRATWENALTNAEQVHHTAALILLIEMALDQHFDWIEPIMNEKVLFAAATAGSLSLLQVLLQKGARPSELRYNTDSDYQHTPIVTAAMMGAWDCVRLLLKKTRINEELWIGEWSQGPGSHLRALFQCVETQLSKPWVINPDDNLFYFSQHKQTERLGWCIQALQLFLRAGADVDIPYYLSWTKPLSALDRLHRELATPPEWFPTCLDMSLYWDEQLFSSLCHYSSNYNSPSKSTRAGIIHSLLDGGNEALDQYFRVKSRPAQSILELLLVEQFYLQLQRPGREYTKVNVHLARLFIEYGVGINSKAVQHCGGVSCLLSQLMTSAQTFSYNDDTEFILMHLLRNGAIICEDLLRLAVQRNGIRNLEALATFGADVQRNGKLALLRAVSLKNYQAVEWLLQRGTSILSEFATKGERSTLIAAALRNLDLDGAWVSHRNYRPVNKPLDLPMLEFLLKKGAPLKYHPLDPSPFRLFRHWWCLEQGPEVAEFLLHHYSTEMAKLSDVEWQALYGLWAEAILKTERILETFKLQHRGFDAGYILADAICMSGRRALDRPDEPPAITIEGGVAKLLEDSSNIELYSPMRGMNPLQAAAWVCDNQLVQSLLHRGADVNAPAAKKGWTAIGAICEVEPCSVDEARKRISIIRLLIQNGADLYAKNTDVDLDAIPVLNILAERGDLDAAAVLLEHGVDPNYAEWIYSSPVSVGLSALDQSVICGRLDMTHLLLKSGGLSAMPGDTGYSGAVQLAITAAIRELIQRHENQMEDDFAQYPVLRRTHQAMVDQQVRRHAEAALQFRVRVEQRRAREDESEPDDSGQR